AVPPGSFTASDRAHVANPFKGLRAFEEADADDFFGRDRLITEVVARLVNGACLVALVGPSGSGKSTLGRAGLLPALRRGAIPGSAQWLIASMTPGSQPLLELEAALLRCAGESPPSLAESLADEMSGLLRAALRVLPDNSRRLLLIIDQFEELFTLVEDT